MSDKMRESDIAILEYRLLFFNKHKYDTTKYGSNFEYT